VSASDARSGHDRHSPWAFADGWRVGHASPRPLWLEWRGTRIELQVIGNARNFKFESEAASHTVQLLAHNDDHLTMEIDRVPQRVGARASGEDLLVHVDGRRYRFHPARPYGFEASAQAADDRVRAPMPGRIVAVQVAVGDRVEAQQALLVMEAMKMELTLRANQTGTIAELRAAVGEFVEADTILVRFEETKQ
jgi:3-methylcrotonyl-CoA carboxylase alpha subunit